MSNMMKLDLAIPGVDYSLVTSMYNDAMELNNLSRTDGEIYSLDSKKLDEILTFTEQSVIFIRDVLSKEKNEKLHQDIIFTVAWARASALLAEQCIRHGKPLLTQQEWEVVIDEMATKIENKILENMKQDI